VQIVTSTTIAIAHSSFGALSFPPAGSPKIVNAPSPSRITAAPPTSRRPTRWFVNSQPSGSAKTIVVTSNGWMTASRPRSSAPAWST
jgi:hypothetical protein